MMRRAMISALMLFLAGAARAGVAPADRALKRQLRGSIQEDERQLKQVTADQHKELLLVREREKSDLAYVKASAIKGETLHAAILEIHERRRRERLALRARGREERNRLRRAVADTRARIVALRKKK